MTVVRRLTAATFMALASVSLVAVPAHAEDAYRYWGFWRATASDWEMAQKGPAEVVPADGSVEGWRFATAGMNDRRTPRAKGDFAAICAQAPAEPGRKRVAVLVDQGTAADAPTPADKPNGQVQGVCVVTAPESTSAQILDAVGEIRREKGAVCAVAGYPGAGCMDTIKQAPPAAPDEKLTVTVLPPKGSTAAAPAAPAEPSNGADVVPWAVGGGLVIALGAGAYAMSRRRTRDDEAA